MGGAASPAGNVDNNNAGANVSFTQSSIAITNDAKTVRAEHTSRLVGTGFAFPLNQKANSFFPFYI